MKFVFFALTLLVVTFNNVTWSFASETAPASRQYPGGADEQDLRVQPELIDPTLKTDRRSFEQKIMQNIFKKNTTTDEGRTKTSATQPKRQSSSKPAAKKN